MVGSLIFPKVDGDVFYGADANRGAGVLWIGAGSTAFFNSGTAIQTLGSIYVNLALYNPSTIKVNVAWTNNSAHNLGPQIRLSGLSANLNVSGVAAANAFAETTFLVGSPFNGYGMIKINSNSSATNEAGYTLSNLNVGSPFVIFLDAVVGNLGSAMYSAYNAYALGRGY